MRKGREGGREEERERGRDAKGERERGRARARERERASERVSERERETHLHPPHTKQSACMGAPMTVMPPPSTAFAHTEHTAPADTGAYDCRHRCVNDFRISHVFCCMV